MNSYNKEEILAMEAGNELNVMVATKIFNRNLPTLDQMKEIAEAQWKVQPDCVHFFRGFDAWMKDGEFKWKYNEKDYSSDISAAWEVKNAIKEKGLKSRIVFSKELQLMFRAEGTHELAAWPSALFLLEPIHICKAALLAVMEDNQ